MRDSTIFYRSFYESIQELPLDSQAKIYNAIFNYSLNGQSSELSGIESAIFTLIKPQLDANNKRYENGKKPKTKPKESETEAKPKQELSKTEANKNDNVNVNENKNVNENDIGSGSGEPAIKKDFKVLLLGRKEKFKNDLKPFLNNPYSSDMLNAFYTYWSEADKSFVKMRFEKEKTWELLARLRRWYDNQKDKPNSNNDKSIEFKI